MIVIILALLAACESVILDPALYLSPSPPLTRSESDSAPAWTSLPEQRVQRHVNTPPDNEEPAKEETMEKAETVWPSLRGYGLGGITIPVTFRLSGSYGRYGSGGMGVIASSYGGSSEGLYGKLAGTGYGYGSGSGTRIYGGNTGSGWSGWGNGKWGHYGKG